MDLVRGLAAAAVAVALGIAGSATAQADPGADSTITYDDNDVTQVTLEFAKGVQDMANKYGYPVDITVRYIWEDENGVAGMTFGGNLVLDEGEAENPAAFYDDAEYNYQQGFWPITPCDAARFVGIHEYGHIIDFHSVGDAEAVVAAKYGGIPLWGGLPGYSLNEDGTIEPGEALANAFAAVECGAGGPMEKDLHRILIESQ